MQDITELIEAWGRGDPSAFNSLVPLVYEELRRRAHGCLGNERNGHTLQTTDLVHEAYLRLAGIERANWVTRQHFLGIAAHLMRQVLVDYARTRNAAKRGAGVRPAIVTDAIPSAMPDIADVLALDAALRRLAAVDDRQARIVELRYFAGLNIDETAAVLDVSTALVKREWRFARAWLYSELGGEQST